MTTYNIVSHYYCKTCDVEGRDSALEPDCWCCGGAVVVTARPAVPVSAEKGEQ